MIKFFTISNSVRTDRSGSGLPLSTFVSVNYLMKYTHSSKGQSSYITLTLKKLHCNKNAFQ